MILRYFYLDDVLSELDSNRQNYLLNSICDTQTIITCTGLDEFIRNRFEINKVFEVISGQVFEKRSSYRKARLAEWQQKKIEKSK